MLWCRLSLRGEGGWRAQRAYQKQICLHSSLLYLFFFFSFSQKCLRYQSDNGGGVRFTKLHTGRAPFFLFLLTRRLWCVTTRTSTNPARFAAFSPCFWTRGRKKLGSSGCLAKKRVSSIQTTSLHLLYHIYLYNYKAFSSLWNEGNYYKLRRCCGSWGPTVSGRLSTWIHADLPSDHDVIAGKEGVFSRWDGACEQRAEREDHSDSLLCAGETCRC